MGREGPRGAGGGSGSRGSNPVQLNSISQLQTTFLVQACRLSRRTVHVAVCLSMLSSPSCGSCSGCNTKRMAV